MKIIVAGMSFWRSLDMIITQESQTKAMGECDKNAEMDRTID